MSIKKVHRYYVYLHVRNDTGVVFYVGKGKDFSGPTGRHWNFHRANTRCNRNPLWKNVVAKSGGYKVKIFAVCENEDFAFLIETLLIKHYGRKDNNTGTLVNMTDGGDGVSGAVITPEQRRLLSESASRPRSEAWIASIRIARKNGGNGGVVKKGDKLPLWWRRKIAATKVGSANPMFGRTGKSNHNSRSVIDVSTGESFESVTEAAQKRGINMKYLYEMLVGRKRNKTTMRINDAS